MCSTGISLHPAAVDNVFTIMCLMQRLEIEDPVEDQVGYVYEKASMLQYIKENGGSVKCPAGGESLTFTHMNICTCHE